MTCCGHSQPLRMDIIIEGEQGRKHCKSMRPPLQQAVMNCVKEWGCGIYKVWVRQGQLEIRYRLTVRKNDYELKPLYRKAPPP